MKIKVNLSAGETEIEQKLAAALEEAVKGEARLIEISYGTHVGELKRRILNFLNKKENRRLYHRMEKTEEGWGRIFIHFRR
jgi:TnpA family transposase